MIFFVHFARSLWKKSSYFYTSEVNEGIYIGMPNPYSIFSDWAKTFFVGVSYRMNTVCLSASP